MWRFLAGAAACFLLMTGAFLLWQSHAQQSPLLPPAPPARSAVPLIGRTASSFVAMSVFKVQPCVRQIQFLITVPRPRRRLQPPFPARSLSRAARPARVCLTNEREDAERFRLRPDRC